VPPLNPVTAHGPAAPVAPTSAATTDTKDEPVFAGRKLSYYRAKVAAAKPKDETEALKVLTEIDGVGEATAGKIAAALEDEDAANKK
jgi:hypothetical protein